VITFLLSMILWVVPQGVTVDPAPIDPGVNVGNIGSKPPVVVNPKRPAPVVGSPAPVEEWVPDPFYCRPQAPFPNTDHCIPLPEDGEPGAQRPATPGQVREEVKRVGLASVNVHVQPAGATLVNFETILSTTAAPIETTVTVLGTPVEIKASAASFTWHHGDGTSQTTSKPGRPYPAKDVVHQYRKPGHVNLRVDVNYQVDFRIEGGSWQQLADPITAPGPATALRVREARPVLSR